jgi:hypothetical protein
MAPPRVSSYTIRKPGSKIVRLCFIHSYSTGHAFSSIYWISNYILLCVFEIRSDISHPYMHCIYSTCVLHSTPFYSYFYFTTLRRSCEDLKLRSCTSWISSMLSGGLAQVVTLVICVLKVAGSHLGLETDYCAKGFSCFLLVLAGNFRVNTSY